MNTNDTNNKYSIEQQQSVFYKLFYDKSDSELYLTYEQKTRLTKHIIRLAYLLDYENKFKSKSIKVCNFINDTFKQ